jgi:hypothetical protein
MRKLFLSIAETSVAIQADEAIAFFLPLLMDFYRGFLEKRASGKTLQVTLSYNPLATHRRFKAIPTRLPQKKKGPPSHGSLADIGKGYPLSDESLLVGFLNGVLAYNARSRQGHICLFRSPGKNLILGSLHKLLFLFMAIALAEQNKFLIHGAGLNILSEGNLFLGHSGAGKSTVAGYAGTKTILSDDAPVVTEDGSAFTIHASPFSQAGLFETKEANHHQRKAPLERLIFLRQASHTELRGRDGRSALAELIQHHIHGFDIMDRALKASAFHFCCEMCRSIPAFDLYFQKDNQFLSLLGYPQLHCDVATEPELH